MDMEIEQNEYERIGEMIASKESAVGIDVKKTHILILYRLTQMERRLEAIETELSKR